ncbi:AI-2E family transporter [Novosphingobium bradum]|uniref:AI-2E family transporter n=1 Tax=Novosphingobium bradum TaxID=1737444 RepID=A0ABV7INQ6_9SPHN
MTDADRDPPRPHAARHSPDQHQPFAMAESAAIGSNPAVFAAQELRLTSALVMLLGIGLFLALPFVLSIGSVVFLPLVTALILSIVLAPLADQFLRAGLPNGLASMLSVLVLVLFLLVAITLIIQPALVLVDDVPAMVSRATQQIVRLRSSFDWLNDINRALARVSGRPPTREVIVAAPSLIEQLAVATPSVILETLLTFLMSYFMVESRLRLRRHLLHDRTSAGSSRKAARLLREIQDRVGTYILTVALINVGVGAITATGAWLLGWNAPIMWGGLAALLNFIPYIGPLSLIGVLALVGLSTADTVGGGLIAPAAYLCLHAIEANAITPAILGRRFTVNPVLILFSFSYFTWVWGVLGALLSVPILITLTAAFEHLGKPNLIGFIFGEPLFPHLPETAMGEETAGGARAAPDAPDAPDAPGEAATTPSPAA